MNRILNVVLVLAVSLAASCSTAPKSQYDKDVLHNSALATIARFKEKDPGMTELFNSAHAYAVFPTVGKGAVGVGGAYGKGEVFQDGVAIGYCDLSQATIGLQLGGQSYSEVILFKDDLALQTFKDGKLAFAAQASAVAATAGASADADYENGVIVFTMTNGGLMYEASIGGQKFSYVPQ